METPKELNEVRETIYPIGVQVMFDGEDGQRGTEKIRQTE